MMKKQLIEGLSGIITGLILLTFTLFLFKGTPAEGYLAFLIGFYGCKLNYLR